MKHIKTYENYNISENWIGQSMDWIKQNFSAFISKLIGDVKKGADYGERYLEQNPEELEKILKELEHQDKSEIMKLWEWVKSFLGKSEDQIEAEVQLNESNEETTLMKIARISGASLTLLTIFGSVFAALAGLIMSNGLLFMVGAVVGIISFSIVGAMK